MTTQTHTLAQTRAGVNSEMTRAVQGIGRTLTYAQLGAQPGMALRGGCPLTYPQLWAAVEKEAEPQALRLLQTFIESVPTDVCRGVLDKQRLSAFDARSGCVLC